MRYQTRSVVRAGWVIVVFIALLSCKEVSFREPQPASRQNLIKVPSELQGNYLPVMADGELGKDTLIIHDKGYRFGYYDPKERVPSRQPDEGLLSDSLVLKKYKGYYFASFRDDQSWIVRVLQP